MKIYIIGILILARKEQKISVKVQKRLCKWKKKTQKKNSKGKKGK